MSAANCIIKDVSRDCDGERRVEVILSEGKDLSNCFSSQNKERFDQITKIKDFREPENLLVFLSFLKFANEPPTRFHKCVKCNHTWREYK
jgi:DNA-directed RNA polymerase subunit M/transcription elongation factor TFIIS